MHSGFGFRYSCRLVSRSGAVDHWEEVPNLVPQLGQLGMLYELCQAVNLYWPTTTFYVGLCNQVPVNDMVETDITTEPGVVNGYARQQLPRNNTGWPGFLLINNYWMARSQLMTWTASGGAFDKPFSRLFSATGNSAGTLISVSGGLTQPLTLADGESFQAYSELFAVAP